MYNSSFLDTKRYSMNIGFYSEFFCEYPAASVDLYVGNFAPSNPRLGYSFKNETIEYSSSTRQWFESSTLGSGLTILDSTYIYAGTNLLGSTSAKTFSDSNDSMYGSIANNILPFRDTQDPDDLTKNLFFESGVSDIGYVIQDYVDVENLEENKDNIIQQIALTVVFDQNGNENSIQKQQQISDTWSVGTIDDVNGTQITYVSFHYSGDKYIFFSDLELVSARSDDSAVREAKNTVSFISNKDLIEDNLREIIKDNQAALLKFYVILSLSVSICMALFAILSSQKLSNTIMDNIIDM